MKLLEWNWKIVLIFFLPLFVAQSAFALPSFKQGKTQETNAVLKADEIDGDKLTNILTARGNVEVAKGISVMYANEMSYDKNSKKIHATGNVKIKNIEVGNMRASEADMKDDFSSGTFLNSKMVFTDGSYLDSPRVERETPNITTLYKPIFALCPDDDIAKNNELAGKKWDLASIKSSSTTIDKEKNVMKTRHGIFRIYNFPVFYTPFIKIPLPSKERESGFLPPSYTKTTNFGVGLKIPYYFNIAPNLDLTVTPWLNLNSNQIILGNELRHLTSYGKYQGTFEIANNEVKPRPVNTSVVTQSSTALISTTDKQYRWHLIGNGIFDFTKNTGLDFTANTVSDTNYLRDYHFTYLAYTMSKVNLDYINKRDYYSIQSIRFQELQDKTNADQAQFVLPAINTHNEFKSLFAKEKLILTSNVTTIAPTAGLQYRRATIIPEVKVPFNVRGNLIDIDAKFQGDFYWLENNFKNTPPTNNYDSTQSNYKPEISLNWRLPLIQKSRRNTLIFEPMVSLVSSSYKTNFNKIANEDSNNSELTVSNLFTSDRIYGFDRNEAGGRISYGAKSSLFNSLGEFGLTVGQSYRKSSSPQDVTIRGFGANNKSDIVGQALYKATKYFAIFYNFQLNESNYRNEVNQVTTSLTFSRFSFSSDYLLIKKSQQNLQQVEQLSFSSTAKLSQDWSAMVSSSKDLVLGRTLSRGITLNRNGCCTIFGFSVIETNPSSLTKAQRTFNINFSFKNL